MLPTPKTVPVFHASTTNAGTASGVVDCKGYDYAVISILEPTSNDTTNNPSVMAISEGDTSTSFTNVSGLVGDTDFTIPASLTSGLQIHQFRIDLRSRKRWLKVAVSPVTTQVLSCQAHLHRGEESPVSASAAGAATLVEV